MSLINKIRSLPHQKKVNLLLGIVLAVFVLLIAFWVVVGNYNNGAAADTSFFQIISKSIKDFENRHK